MNISLLKTFDDGTQHSMNKGLCCFNKDKQSEYRLYLRRGWSAEVIAPVRLSTLPPPVPKYSQAHHNKQEMFPFHLSAMIEIFCHYIRNILPAPVIFYADYHFSGSVLRRDFAKSTNGRANNNIFFYPLPSFFASSRQLQVGWSVISRTRRPTRCLRCYEIRYAVAL